MGKNDEMMKLIRSLKEYMWIIKKKILEFPVGLNGRFYEEGIGVMGNSMGKDKL